MFAIFSMAFYLSSGLRISEILVYLFIELMPVGDDEEGIPARQLAQYLLSKVDHGDALATSLSMPENAQPPLVLADILQDFNGVVDTKILMVLGGQLDIAALSFHEDREILYKIEKASWLAGAA